MSNTGVVQSTDDRNPISKIKKAVSYRSRKRRSELFERFFPNSDHAKIVDLGGGKGRHFNKHYARKRNVHIADYNASDLSFASANYGYIPRLVDGTEAMPFVNEEFDIVFCNSVIEHVTGPKKEAVQLFTKNGTAFALEAWAHQVQFAAEIRRVGNGYYVQTPCKWFPIEVHSWIPVLGYFPSHIQWRIIRVFNNFWPRKHEEADWALLTKKQMSQLFPDGEIVIERFLGFPKSLIAIRKQTRPNTPPDFEQDVLPPS